MASKEGEDSRTALKYQQQTDFLLSLLGIRPGRPNDLLFAMNCVIMGYMNILNLAHFFHNIDNFEKLPKLCLDSSCFLALYILISLMRVNDGKLGDLWSEIQLGWTVANYTSKEWRTVNDYVERGKLLLKLIVYNVIISTVGYYFLPLLLQAADIVAYAKSTDVNDSLKLSLPYCHYNFEEIGDMHTFIVGYVIQLPVCVYFIFNCNAMESSLIFATFNICGQMAIVNQRVTNIDYGSSSECREKLFKLVQLHCKLIRMGTLLEDAFATGLSSCMLAMILLICMVGFQIVMCLESGDKASIAIMLIVLVSVLLLQYIWCMLSEYLLTESDKLCEAFYDCKWYDMKCENAKLILFCLARSQKPLKLRAGAFAIFSYDTFSKSVKMSAGYLSVLLTIM